jgi:BirA family transcriptional regulator, biotin operon repressor / biotin---[acetyl-CoA-carboxylase] ligase
MLLPDPKFPPLLRGYAIKAPLKAHDEACRLVSLGTLGAGDLVWSRNLSQAQCALILEPDVSRAQSQQMAPLAMVALAEALGSLCPPELAVEFRWPDQIYLNGGDAGRMTMTAPDGLPDEMPPWIVIALDIALAARDHEREPGLERDITALAEEGAGDVTRTAILEQFAACMLAWLDTWSNGGFRPIHDQWLFRAIGRGGGFHFENAATPTTVLGLDEAAGLLVKISSGEHAVLPFAVHVRAWP